MMGCSRIKIGCCLTFLLLMQAAARAETAYLRPASVFAGDIADLVIEYDNDIPSLYALDTSPLDANFEVLDINSRVSRVMESSRVFHRMQSILQIRPRNTGRLVVPILHFGGRSTPRLELEVLPLPMDMQSSRNVFVELVAAPQNPYVGQQIRVITRLIHNTPISDGILSEPATLAGSVYRSGEDNHYSITRDGGRFDVLERSLVLFAAAPGKLSLTSARYRGQIEDSEDAAGDNRVLRRKISRSSAALQLRVRDQPHEYGGRFWLPAQQLEITQDWNLQDSDIRVGDSLDWILTITARGLAAEALPADLLTMDSAKFRIYADQAIRSNSFDGNGIVGHLKQRFAVIMTSPGEVELPAVTLAWWDLGEDRERLARLPRRSLKVAEIAAPALNSESQAYVDGNDLQLNLNDYWPHVVLTGLLAISLFFVRSTLQSAVNVVAPRLRRRRLEQCLRLTCLSNNAAATRVALIAWARERWPHEAICALHQIATHFTCRELIDELQRLDATLYAAVRIDWQGRDLWQLITRQWRSNKIKPEATANRLPALYPG